MTTNATPLDQVNDMFSNSGGANPPAAVTSQQPSAQPAPVAQPASGLLATQDSMFNDPIGPSQKSIDQANAYLTQGVDLSGGSSGAPSAISNIPDPLDAAAVGAVAGAVVGSKSAITPAPKNNSLLNAQATAFAQNKAAEKINSAASSKETQHLQKLENTKLALENSKIKHAETTAQHMSARDEAARLNALPAEEIPLTKMEKEMLDKAVADAKTAGIAIDEGAMAHSIKMGNIRNYNQVRKGIQGTKESLPAAEKTALSGMKHLGHLIVPDTVADASLLNPQQLEAQKKYLETKNAMKSTAADVAKHQGILESLTKKGAVTPQLENKVLDKNVKAVESAEKAKFLQDALKESTLSKIGRLAGKAVGPILGGAGVGFEGAEAMKDYQNKDYLPMALHGMSAVGSGLSMVPHPVAKGAGLLMAAPGMAYDIYQALHPGALPSGKQ
jgi:hypothetical protein